MNGVLVKSAAGPAPDAEILRGLQECRCHRQTAHLRAQAINDLRSSNLALIERFKAHVDEARIGGALAAGERDDVGNGGVVTDYPHQLFNGVIHEGERCVLRTLKASDNSARILLRKESLGNFIDQYDVEGDREQQNRQHQHRMIERPSKRLAVGVEHPCEELFTGAIHPVVTHRLAFFDHVLFKQVRTHGGSGG